MQGFGAKLRDARLAMKLSLRDVEERTGELARQWNNPAYKTSASWLDRIEGNKGGLSATKLIVLAAIYNLGSVQMLALCPIGEPNPLEPKTSPNVTMLLGDGPLLDRAKLWIPDEVTTEPPPEVTMLIPTPEGLLPVQYRRGIIGKKDRALEPMVQPGSIVLIDTKRRTIAGRREWNNEFDRPIYFLLTRSGHTVGFCEVDRESEWLTVVPHPLSYASTQRWRYRKEVEVVGTVTAVLSRRAA